MPKIARSMRHDPELLKFYTSVAKISKRPRDELIREAMRKYMPMLKARHPNYKFVKVRSFDDV